MPRKISLAATASFASPIKILLGAMLAIPACGQGAEGGADSSSGQHGETDETSNVLDASEGDACDACESPRVCVEGECRLPPACGPANCEGCCDEDDQCHPGDGWAACGRQGQACASCSGDASCIEGGCVLPCDSSCAGCCDPQGHCLDGASAEACGKDGHACTSCGDDVCSNGQCIDALCSATCEGCCDEGGCRDGVTDSLCGAGGQSCQACGRGQSCNDAVCTVHLDSRWDVILVNAEVPPTKPDGGAWDPFGGLPDPYLRMNVGSVEGQSSHQTDTLSPSWGTGEVVITNISAQQIFAGPVYMAMWDYDPTWFDDFMFECVVDVDNELFMGDLNESCVGAHHVIRWKLAPHDGG